MWKYRKFVVSVDGKQIMFQSFGTRTRIRGKNFMGNRPDEIDIDDLLNDENVESELKELLERVLEGATTMEKTVATLDQMEDSDKPIKALHA